MPRITKAYARYSMEYCLLTVGRRGRDWGLGMYMDSGDDIFDMDYTVYDGVTCDINLQKSQTLGFSVGFDKISETGGSVVATDASSGVTTDAESFGPTNASDDLGA